MKRMAIPLKETARNDAMGRDQHVPGGEMTAGRDDKNVVRTIFQISKHLRESSFTSMKWQKD